MVTRHSDNTAKVFSVHCIMRRCFFSFYDNQISYTNFFTGIQGFLEASLEGVSHKHWLLLKIKRCVQDDTQIQHVGILFCSNYSPSQIINMYIYSPSKHVKLRAWGPNHLPGGKLSRTSTYSISSNTPRPRIERALK